MSHDFDLDEVNEQRRRKGLRPLTLAEAKAALSARDLTQTETPHQDTSMDFLIGITTGIPMPSTEGVVGAMLHNANHPQQSDPSYSPPEHSYTPPEPPASIDTSPSPAPDFGGGGDSSGGGSF